RNSKLYTVHREVRDMKGPRLEVLCRSFDEGGPVVLIGVLGATRKREVLAYSSNMAPNIEAFQSLLFKRCSLFECNSSIIRWFNQAVDQLKGFGGRGGDPQALACMMYCLGTPQIPRALLVECRQPATAYDSRGELDEVPLAVSSLVRDDTRCAAAL